MGVNGNDYNPRAHRIVSAASCTTTCLAHMMRPLINAFGAKRILSASMATVHAATSSQEVLDRLPEAGKTDLRKSRSIMNNIILTSTGAANALRLVIPEMKEIPFIAESVRIPTSAGSLIILVINLQEEPAGGRIDRTAINAIYRQAAAESPEGYLIYTDEQNVSADIIGIPRAAAIIEGHETHTRTAEACVDLAKVPGLDADLLASMKTQVIRIPVTQAVIYGWYDNENGSYVHMLGDRSRKRYKSRKIKHPRRRRRGCFIYEAIMRRRLISKATNSSAESVSARRVGSMPARTSASAAAAGGRLRPDADRAFFRVFRRLPKAAAIRRNRCASS
jgi:glyceraldehyde 3-phosphate dehydrogenase